MKEVPKYDGALCTSGCGKDFDCPHEDAFDEYHGIVRSHLDFDVKCKCNDPPTIQELIEHLSKQTGLKI